MENIAVSFKNVTKTFGEVVANKDVSFDIYKGETLGIVGESGCGKSMTAMSIMRLLNRTAKVSGKIELDGQDLLSMSDKEFRKIRGNRISMIFQHFNLFINGYIHWF